ncbi:hypothetical protein BaRGS_00001808 [Batillaria attramentaria]|uniref:Uncharacterized protein n=1 Tax=Batillaria attramentaria TaxID=370345 RepID=A0ABD0M5N2_9CAEN
MSRLLYSITEWATSSDIPQLCGQYQVYGQRVKRQHICDYHTAVTRTLLSSPPQTGQADFLSSHYIRASTERLKTAGNIVLMWWWKSMTFTLFVCGHVWCRIL